jgi:6-phosphogluconolactonase
MAGQTYLYVGCYTNDSSIGIHVYDWSDPAVPLVERSTFEGVEQPSFLAAHPSGTVLYAVSETAGPDGGNLAALRIDPIDGSLGCFDRAPSHGSAPCYVSVDADGRYLYVANYLSGTVAAYALEHDGRFGQLVGTHQHRGSGPTARQEGPHAHCIVPGPVSGAVYGVDLGTDRVSRYLHDRRDGVDAFVLDDELALEPGAGPRHLAFHPELPVGFLVCELDSTIVTLGLDSADGSLTRRGSASTLPEGYDGESIAAEVRVHPTGRYVYASNRGHDSIAVFGFAGPAEPLEPLGHVHSGGRTPRNFAVHPSGGALMVANQDSNRIVPFAIDAATGVPSQIDGSHHASQPVCLTVLEVER